MKARTSSQVLAGLLCAATVWLLSLLTSVLGIPSWKDGVGYVNNCRNACSLMMSSCVIFGHFQMINTHTSTSVRQGRGLDNKVSPQGRGMEALVFLQMFPYFLTLYRSLFMHSHTNTHTHTHTHRESTCTAVLSNPVLKATA